MHQKVNPEVKKTPGNAQHFFPQAFRLYWACKGEPLALATC